jgi:hypothetical protein
MMDAGEISGISAGAILILAAAYKMLHHFKCTSNCCGSKSSLEVDLGTPPKTELLSP